MRCRRRVDEANVFLQAEDCELALERGQPGGGGGEVWQDEEGEEGDEDCDCALDDEEPAPGRDAEVVVEVAGYAGRDEAREGAGEEGAGVEDRGAHGEFFARVP